MNATSPWSAAVNNIFHGQDLSALFTKDIKGYKIKVYSSYNSFWIVVTCPKGSQIVLRPAYSPNENLIGFLEIQAG